MTLEPMNEWILVRVLPEPASNGLLVLPSEPAVCRAEVLKVGPGKLTKTGGRIPVDVRPGEVVTFLRWHLEHQQGQQLKPRLEELGADLGLIKQDDILVVIGPGEKVKIEHNPDWQNQR